jgi:glycosyltransferase involved in cell wall biosynthesis
MRDRVIHEIVGRKVEIDMLYELRRGALANGHLPDVLGPRIGLKPDGIDVPCVGYIYDCQHRRMANFFSAGEIAARDTLFTRMLRELPVVIVTSEEAKSDLLRYFPHISSEIVTLPFAASPLPDWLSINSMIGREKYRLPLKYFLCSNQFWQHKNHRVVFEALSLARAEGRPIFMVFTGLREDYRAPAYPSHLMSQVQNLGVAGDCLFLGLVPKRDNVAIMKSATALIQPTLFEGNPGGGAVHDAISVGCPVIVSDIPVNREIEKYVDAFFPPSDAASLLRAMRRIESVPKQEKPEKVLLVEGRQRRRHCGEVIRRAFARAAQRAL